MATSPSPGTGASAPFMTTAAAAQVRRSPSPPTAPLSKRDKRRTMIDQRLKDIASSFSRDRDTHLRTQLNALSRDMHYITRLDPYAERPLDDGPEDLEVGSVDGEQRIPLGRFATRFVDTVNDELEGRDATITEGELAFRNNIANLRMEYDFALEVAAAEARALRDTARTRVVGSLHAKRRAIQKEKEQLDTADSTYLMNTHALTALATPGSPGGAYASRKTRYTRNRQDPEAAALAAAAEAAAGVAADSGSQTGAAAGGNGVGKRKRKAAGGGGGAAGAELDHDSPGPSGVAGGRVEALPGRGTPLGTALGATLWEKGKATVDQDQLPSTVSADRFFSARELVGANRTAHERVATAWKRAVSLNQDGMLPAESADDTDGGFAAAGNGTGTAAMMDYAGLVAPAMDRAAGSSQHATRSTRLAAAPIVADPLLTAAAVAAAGVLPPTMPLVPLDTAWEEAADPRRLYGAAVLEALHIRPKGVTAKDLEAPLTTMLDRDRQVDDLTRIQSLMDMPDD